MRVTILGSGTGEPSVKRASPGLVVSVGKENLLFDLGPGSLRRAREAGFTFLDIDRIFFTHFHVDHVSDLAPLFFACNNPRLPRTEALPIYGPRGLKAFYTGLLGLYGDQIDTKGYYTLDLHELGEEEIRTEYCTIRTRSLPHTESSLGYRIEGPDGRTAVYSGDTDYCANLVDLARSADLLILESAFPNSYKVEGHLTPLEAGRPAKEAGAKRLLLIHLYPLCDSVDVMAECRDVFGGEIMIAEDLMRIDV